MPRKHQYKVKIKIGDIFGQYQIIDEPYLLNDHRVAMCKCNCGIEEIIRLHKLIHNIIDSCRKCRIAKQVRIRGRQAFNGYKTCCTCKIPLSIDNFNKGSDKVDGYSVQCKSCMRQTKLLKDYGISENYYNKMLERQNFKCAICGIHIDEYKNRLRVDHNHSLDFKHARGLLCSTCNSGLGLFGDSIDTLNRAVEYLRNSELMIHKNDRFTYLYEDEVRKNLDKEHEEYLVLIEKYKFPNGHIDYEKYWLDFPEEKPEFAGTVVTD